MNCKIKTCLIKTLETVYATILVMKNKDLQRNTTLIIDANRAKII